ncbi:PREDICTED: WAT1-related protein At3g30340-like isoform X2 [Ipomoea nil]|uniref:WAT1-related protein At3g30340-like isoform X2 n=1 Tax=Ipomoea nil TaxID=35883 RepID=UPI0009016255|nr:PREDICTED: WAT1-related protein At3g30340-like isoform X2 [Ipomoea nil]
MMNCLNSWKPGAAMIAVNFAFAVANILFKMVLNRGVNQLVLTTYRQSISAIFLVPIGCGMERKSYKKLTAFTFCALFFSGLIGGALTLNLFLIGLKYTSTSFACAFINIVPINTFLLALLFRQERINMKCKSGKAKVLGTLICLIGAIVLTLYKGKPLTNNASSQGVEAHHNTKSWVLGSLFLFAGSLSWSSWFIIQGRVGSDYPYQYSSTSIMSFFGAIQSATFCFIIDRNKSIWRLKGSLEIWTIIYSGIVGSSICYVVMSWCVKQKGPVFTSTFSPFIQIFAIVLDVSILHEQIHIGSILGSILVIVGLYVLLWGKSKEVQVCKTAPTPNKDAQTVLPVTNTPSRT